MRSVADALRQFTAPDLARLLRARPDACLPVPQDLAELASRLSAAASVRRVLDQLNRPQVTVTEALAASPEPISAADVADLVGFEVATELAVLRQLALIWGDDAELRVVRGLRQAYEPFPGGLAEPSLDPLGIGQIESALAGLPAAAQEVLEKLMWGPPTGAVRNADRVVTDPATPIDHLLARRLLRPLDAATVVLPREVALHLRGRFSREPVGPPPAAPRAGSRPARIIDSAAVGAAYEIVHELEGVLDELSRRAPAPLRSRGLAARDLAAIARTVSASEARTGFVLEVAHAADLLTTSGPSIVPTDAFDRWLALPLAARHQHLLQAWASAPRWFPAGWADSGRPLADGEEVWWAAPLRQRLIGPLSAGDLAGTDELAAHAAWHQPALQRAGELTALTRAVLTEADWLGLTAFGQASALVAGFGGELGRQVEAMFPEMVDHVILQADLTAVATGPLDRGAAAAIALLADVESRGGGGVYRFTAASVRRAFDAGWTAEQVEQWLTTHSTTGVPQPLRYLVGDVARLHGTVRVGAARAYVRIDDPARLRTVLAHPEAAALGVRQVGPETLVADAEPAEVVELLRAVGLAPAAENALGEVLASPSVRRPSAPARRKPPALDAEAIATALVAHGTAQQATLRTEETLAVLGDACDTSRPLLVDYVDADGGRVSATMVPLELSGGAVRLAGAGVVVSVPLARITGARWADPD